MTGGFVPTDDPPKVFDLRAHAGAERLDLFLAGQDLELTRSQLRRLINEGHVLLNGRAAKGSQRVRTGDLVSLSVPAPRPSKNRGDSCPADGGTRHNPIEHLTRPCDSPFRSTIHSLIFGSVSPPMSSLLSFFCYRLLCEQNRRINECTQQW